MELIILFKSGGCMGVNSMPPAYAAHSLLQMTPPVQDATYLYQGYLQIYPAVDHLKTHLLPGVSLHICI